MRNIFYAITTIIISLLVFACVSSQITEPEKDFISQSVSLSKEWKKIKSKDSLTIPYGFHIDSTNIITPRAYECGVRYVLGWTLDSFAPMSGKDLGVWAPNSNPSWSQYYNKYGFRGIAVSNLPSRNFAHAIGFSDDKIMALIPNYSSAYDLVNDLDMVQYYHIDEPFEDATYNSTTLRLVAEMIHNANSNGKLLMASYKWPTLPWNLPWTTDTWGDLYKSVLNNASNSYIMCDEYYGNIMGTTRDYWQKFRSYYGSSKNITEWMHIDRNATQSTGNSFQDLMGYASNQGINSLWLFATTADSYKIHDFCEDAWYKSWLRGFARNYQLIYRCYYDDPCDCDLNSELSPEEGWYLDEIYYYQFTYEVYP